MEPLPSRSLGLSALRVARYGAETRCVVCCAWAVYARCRCRAQSDLRVRGRGWQQALHEHRRGSEGLQGPEYPAHGTAAAPPAARDRGTADAGQSRAAGDVRRTSRASIVRPSRRATMIGAASSSRSSASNSKLLDAGEAGARERNQAARVPAQPATHRALPEAHQDCTRTTSRASGGRSPTCADGSASGMPASSAARHPRGVVLAKAVAASPDGCARSFRSRSSGHGSRCSWTNASSSAT